MKQISKERIGSKVTKKYDKARTPYQRILENPGVEKIDKEKLIEQYTKLNPAELQREIVKLQKKLLEDISIKEEVRNSIKKISKNKDKIYYGYV
ncbi:hypothetical protein [Thermodesulfobium narugense]|uniref:hypothetical protein n=1 Tax=Thermodesulfobium narugense TaxID=184064 RepID=UPI0002F91C31|nr:hypothetical protein [Thermodesulfobium narugense]